jgi:hypothetical protein
VVPSAYLDSSSVVRQRAMCKICGREVWGVKSEEQMAESLELGSSVGACPMSGDCT